MTLVAPLLFVLFYGLIFYFSVNRDIGATKKIIYVSDNSGLFTDQLTATENIEYVYGHVKEVDQKDFISKREEFYALLVIPKSDSVTLIARDQASFSVISSIRNELEKVLRKENIHHLGLNEEMLKKLDTDVKVSTVKVTEKGLESGNAGAAMAIGFVGAILIYMFILLYGIQIMRGVIEEKTNRIVEVIISSVKPFELMMGKIVGIAMVGLTQFCIWVAIITIFGGGVSGLVLSNLQLPPETSEAVAQGTAHTGSEMGDFLVGIKNMNFPFLIGMFVFYFIGGYLFYGALFAAIGSAVDSETDTQQFMLPVTLPLIFAFILAQSAVSTNPNGPLAFWLSIIPFTSPVVMMMRAAFDVPWWETALSMLCLVLGFVGTVWLAARIYRIGILMYGKKPSYKELVKWIFYRGS